MLDLKKTFENYGSIFVKKLKENHIKAGQKASGKSYEAFGYEATATNLIVFGADNTEYLERGRGVGKAPSTAIIYQWAQEKGLLNQFEKEYQKRGFAFIVARKIGQAGSYLHRTQTTFNGFKNPISSVFTKELIHDMIENITTTITEDVQITINKIFTNFKHTKK